VSAFSLSFFALSAFLSSFVGGLSTFGFFFLGSLSFSIFLTSSGEASFLTKS